MTKQDEWYIYLQDRDQKLYAIAGPVLGAQVDDWLAAIAQEQGNGRELIGQDISRSQLLESQSHAEINGLVETEAGQLLTAPRDKSNDYHGALPSYASKACQAKVIKILCKGKCGRSSWAEMDKPFPGKEVLRTAKFGEYNATCLRCGSIAKDGYNWIGR